MGTFLLLSAAEKAAWVIYKQLRDGGVIHPHLLQLWNDMAVHIQILIRIRLLEIMLFRNRAVRLFVVYMQADTIMRRTESVRKTVIDQTFQRYRTLVGTCLLYTSPSPRDQRGSRMPSSA